MLRSLLDFCSPIYHNMLTLEQSDKLERMQRAALQIIYGFGVSYEDLLNIAGIESLKKRREKAFLKFSNSLAKNPRYAGWLERNENSGRLRNVKKYREHFARSERLYNSPLYAIRRALNAEENISEIEEV